MKVRANDLPMRAKLALVLIVDYMDENVLHQAPQHSLLMQKINDELPPRLSRGKIAPVLSSKEQSFRLAEKLREAGLLVTAPGMQFNMVPTPTGRAWAAQWKPDVKAWTKRERVQWERQGQSEAIQRSHARSVRMAV